MEGGKDCFPLRCAGGAQDRTIINRIMLRFRPIAPKPSSDSSVASGSPSELKKEPAVGRSKRKYVRVKRTRSNNKSKLAEDRKESKDGFGGGTVVTLQLLPKISYPTPTPTIGLSQKPDPPVMEPVQRLLNSITSNNSGNINIAALGLSDWSDRTVSDAVESVVTIECVTETYVDGGGLGSTDTEKMKNLEVDTCPGFISNGVDEVLWVNLAYRRMVDPRGCHGDGGLPPQVVVKEKIPEQFPAFACRVRVLYTRQKEKYSQIVPCDVWRMDFGGFAWKLDVKAALSLGR